MPRIFLSVFFGFILGMIRERLVVGYHGAVIDYSPRRGALTTWGIGHLDFIVMLTMTQFENPFMMYGYIWGETVASYFGIKARK
jgi:hypothetical protein